jgi:hypothetical protein
MSNLYSDSENQMNTKLILCIEERDNKKDYSTIDNLIFIGWSEETERYFVRGRRQDLGDSDSVPYALNCNNADDLYDFLEFVVGAKGRKNIIIYNYNNTTDLKENDMTYEFFEMYVDSNYEIAGYNNIKISRPVITKTIRILKNMYNDDVF